MPYKAVGKFAALFLSKTENQYDLIDFNTSTSSKYGTLTTSFGGSKYQNLATIEGSVIKDLSTRHRSDILLTIAPSFKKNFGEITYKSNGSSVTQEIVGQTTITIKRDDIKFNQNMKKYYAGLTLKDLTVLKAELRNPEPIVEYPLINNLKRSSVIDFSQNLSGKPKYNANLAIYGKDSGGIVHTTMNYYESLGYWVTGGGYNNFFDMKPYSKNDFFMFFENISSGHQGMSQGWYKAGATTLDAHMPGLLGLFSDYTLNLPGLGFGTGGAKQKFIVAGFSQPINMVLYNYMNKPENTDSYVDPANDFNRVALRKVTTEACNKLKSEGTRIYVIKYRVQDKHSELQRNGSWSTPTSSRNHDYGAVEGCATNLNYVYDADDKGELQEKFNAIAADIKDWADYEPAKLIE